jgi:hypothetical protein
MDLSYDYVFIKKIDTIIQKSLEIENKRKNYAFLLQTITKFTKSLQTI